MGAAFSADFSSVRVHTGSAADEVASKLNAHALTAGPDILFRADAYNPGTQSGDRLLAHELAHVVQQAGGLPRAAIDGGAADPLEKAAEAAAGRAVTSGLAAGLAPEPPVRQSDGATAIQRAPERDVDDERVVKGPRPIGLSLLGDDPNMCGGRKCVTDEELDPASLLQPSAAGACAVALDDYSGVGPAGPTEALQGEAAGMDVSSDPVANFDLLQRMWMTYGPAGAELYVYHLLKGMWVQGGPRLVDQFADRFVYRIGLEYGSRIFEDDPAVMRALAMGGAVLAQQKQLHAESDQFITCYEKQATEMARGALDESEKRVTGELKHYFGSSWAGQFLGSKGVTAAAGAAWSSSTTPVTSADDKASRRGLGIAAEGLAKRRNALIRANAAYRSAVREIDNPVRKAQGHSPTLAEREPIEEAHRYADRDYEVFRRQVIPRFPILEEVSSPAIDPLMDEDYEPDDEVGEQLNKLAQLAHGGESEDATGFILNQVADKLKNIAKIREELKPGGEVNVWRVPRIVEATSELTGATPGTFYGKLVENKVNEELPGSLTSRLIEDLEIGLYLLAPFTGDITLIPAVMLTIGRAGSRVYEHWKEYETQKALTGTDFGAAALSAEDPSLFWLGADIAAAFLEVGLSVGPAFKVFRELASAARAARAAKAGEEAVLALKNAAEELTAEELGAEKAGKLAEKVAADAELAQSGGMAGMTPEEAVELGAEDIVRGHPPGRVDPASLEQADLLAQSSVIDDGKALSTAQREAEISIVAQSEPQPSTLEGYVDEVDLGNGHTWRRGEGSTWCRFSGSSLCGTVIPGDKQLARLRTRLTEYGMRPGRARQAGNLRSALDEMAARGDPKATLTIIESIEDALASERLPTRAGTITVDMHDARVSKAFNEAMAAPGLEGNPDWDEYRELVQDRYTTQGSIEIGPSPRSSDPAHVARTEEMRARFLAGMRDGKVSAGAAQMTRDHLARAVRLAGSEAGAVAARDAIWIDRFTGARLLGPGPNAALWPADPLWGVWRVDHIVELQHGGLEMESNYAAAPQRMHAIKSSAMNEFGRIISGIMGAAD